MNVLQRKMFKNPNGRNARDKLKGMGGIMSSSPELANAVQGYEEGDQVRIPGSTNQSTVIPRTISSIFNFFKSKLSGGPKPDQI